MAFTGRTAVFAAALVCPAIGCIGPGEPRSALDAFPLAADHRPSQTWLNQTGLPSPGGDRRADGMDLVADGRATDGLPAPDNLEAAQLSPLPVVTRIEGRHATVPPPGVSARTGPVASLADDDRRPHGGGRSRRSGLGGRATGRAPLAVRRRRGRHDRDRGHCGIAGRRDGRVATLDPSNDRQRA